MSTSTLPVLYLSHGGGPCFWMDWGMKNPFEHLGDFLSGLADTLPKPKALCIISAHWETSEFSIASNPHPQMIYDYYGFPENTYHLEYPAPGAPLLAEKILKLLDQKNISATLDPKRGFDHGVFVPLMKVFPEANIPIVQVSIKASADPQEHYEMGQALSSLRNEGVLIIGSGVSYHNLQEMYDRDGSSELFNNWLLETLTKVSPEERTLRLLKWREAPANKKAHPTPDHFIPMLVVAGAAGEDGGRVIYSEKMVPWGFWTSSFQFE